MASPPDEEPDGLRELRDLRADAEQPAPPAPGDEGQYRVYRSKPRLLGRGKDDGLAELRGERPGRLTPLPTRRKRWTAGRVLKWTAAAIGGWLLLSLLLFLISAQLQRDNVSDAAQSALDDSGPVLTSANNILVLGSDARTKGTREPGASIGGPSRSDSILLMRVGGGKSARLSIPRDTIVDIPGHGRDKINAAYAIGGPSLAILTVKQYLGVEINHLVEVNFDNFPQFIDALGGIDYRGGCVVSRINGGSKNGGFTLRLKSGKTHINGKQALALARTRKNDCNPKESDLTRAKRQQKIMAAIRDRVTGPTTFFRLPWVSWAAPKAIRTDMGGPALLGLFGALATGSQPPTRVLKPSGGETLPNGGAGLTVSDAERQRQVRRFLRG